MPGPSQEELERRRLVGINAETVTNVTSTDFPGHWPGEDHSWNLTHFRNNFSVQFHTNSPHDASFSLVGLDASVANAFRRILLSEIPTLAIEDVFIYNNTSVIQDEVLAHRLGLIPLQGNPAGLNWLRWFKKPTEEDPTSSSPADHNVIILSLKVSCTWQDGGLERAIRGETDANKLYVNHNVYAHQIEWKPVGQQPLHFPQETGGEIKAVNPDILIAKLRPGQTIDLRVHAIKGIGADHAKFSPVATASYRLLPHINITSPILGADAKKFARCFPRGVIALRPVSRTDIEDETRSQQWRKALEGKEGEQMAVVAEPMRDTVSRECLRHEEFREKVKLGRVRDHFIFRVESTGQIKSDELFLESVRLLRLKCKRVQRGLDAMVGR